MRSLRACLAPSSLRNVRSRVALALAAHCKASRLPNTLVVRLRSYTCGHSDNVMRVVEICAVAGHPRGLQ